MRLTCTCSAVSVKLHLRDGRSRKSAPVFDYENRHGRKKWRRCCCCCNYAFI